MEVFPAYFDSKNTKNIKICPFWGFPILDPISGPIFPYMGLPYGPCGPSGRP